MARLTYSVKVLVDKDKAIDELSELISDVDELYDLVPEWSQFEADEITERIFQKMSSLIKTEVKGET